MTVTGSAARMKKEKSKMKKLMVAASLTKLPVGERSVYRLFAKYAHKMNEDQFLVLMTKKTGMTLEQCRYWLDRQRRSGHLPERAARHRGRERDARQRNARPADEVRRAGGVRRQQGSAREARALVV